MNNRTYIKNAPVEIQVVLLYHSTKRYNESTLKQLKSYLLKIFNYYGSFKNAPIYDENQICIDVGTYNNTHQKSRTKWAIYKLREYLENENELDKRTD